MTNPTARIVEHRDGDVLHRTVVFTPGEELHLTPSASLDVMAGAVRHVNEANGWFESERTFGDDLALLHTEVSEALEAYREHGFRDVTAPQERIETTALCEAEPSYVPGALPKPEGFGSELADVLIRLLDTCERRGFRPPLWWHSRLSNVHPVPPLHHHGGSVGDWCAELHYLIANRRLSEVVPLLVWIAEETSIDLDAEFVRKLAYNRTRGHRHGGKRL